MICMIMIYMIIINNHLYLPKERYLTKLVLSMRAVYNIYL